MSRVEDERAAQRYEEQKRIEKDLRAKNHAASDQFKKVVAAKQEGSTLGERRQQAGGNSTRQQQTAGKRSQYQTALLAKNGIQGRNLQAELAKKSASSQEQVRINAHDRHEQLHERHGAERERQVTTQHESDKRVEQYNDHLAALSLDEHKGHGDSEGNDGGNMGGGQMGMPMQQPQTTAPTETLGNAGAARIPEHVLKAMVKACSVKVDPKGLTEFQIELRDDVLSGSRVHVKADGRKISATVVSDDANVRRLFKASEQDLARAFDAAGLSLESFKVSAF